MGLEAIDDGLWDGYFGRLKLGRLHESLRRIEDAYVPLTRKRAGVKPTYRPILSTMYPDCPGLRAIRSR